MENIYKSSDDAYRLAKTCLPTLFALSCANYHHCIYPMNIQNKRVSLPGKRKLTVLYFPPHSYSNTCVFRQLTVTVTFVLHALYRLWIVRKLLHSITSGLWKENGVID